MRYISILILSLLCPILGQSQDTITFSSNGNALSSNLIADKAYSLPLTLQFDSGFKGKEVGFWSSDHKQPLALLNAHFGDKLLGKNIDAQEHPEKTYIMHITQDHALDIDGSHLRDDFAIKIENNYYPVKVNTTTPNQPVKTIIPVSNANYVPGYIYYDALQLKLAYETSKPSDVNTILAGYNTNDNPFLADVARKYPINSIEGDGGTLFSDVLNSAGNLNVTNFADGLARFLVERSKEELNVAFFRKFQTFFDKYPELAVVFPSTCGFLKNINAYQYAAMLPALRAGFQKDMNAAVGNLIKLRNLPTQNASQRVIALTSFLNDDPAGRSVIASLLLTDNIIKGNNAATIIDNLSSDQVCTVVNTSDKFYNVASAVHLVNLISQSLRSKEEGRVWVNKQQVKDLVTNDLFMELYLGLVYAKNKQSPSPVSFTFKGTTVSFQDFLDALFKQGNNPGQTQHFKTTFQEVAGSFSDVADNAQNIATAKDQNNPNTLAIYADYATSISTTMKLGMGLLANNAGVDADFGQLNTEISCFTSIIDGVVDCSYDIKSQNYGALVLHTSDILSLMFKNNYTFKEGYIKYGTFMASVVGAKNSDEVKSAIDAAVLPVGSSSVKRETPMNISLNAFIGPNFGREYMPGLKDKKWSNVAGVTAPVGIAFSFGDIHYGKKKTPDGGPHPLSSTEGGKSFTVFISLIDVGALASYRLQNDSTNVSSEIKLKNIVSPGLFFYYGFGKSPVSLGVGAQLGPQLRDISAKDANLDKNYYIKIGASLVVDIPLFNLFTKSKE